MMLKKGKRVKVDGVGAEPGRDRQGETMQSPFSTGVSLRDPPNGRRILYFIFVHSRCRCKKVNGK